jgi:hypothetical protein
MVSKRVLTRCNTVIAFACSDQTGLDFPANVCGQAHARPVPDLGFVQAVVFGKGIKSGRPLGVETERKEPGLQHRPCRINQPVSFIPGPSERNLRGGSRVCQMGLKADSKFGVLSGRTAA